MLEKLKNLKKFFSKTFVLAALVVFAILIIVFYPWINSQVKKGLSFYHVYRGDNAYKKREYQEAIESYQKALKIYPKHVKARYNLGNIYVVYEDYKNAEKCYREVIKISPDFYNARINLGIILSEYIKNYKEALTHYTKVIDSKKMVISIPLIYNNSEYIRLNKAVAHYNRALVYYSQSIINNFIREGRSKFWKKAAKDYEKSVEYNNKSYESHYNLGLTYQLLKRHNKSLESYCNAIALDPFAFDAHYNLGILLMEKLNYKDAITEFEKAGLILDSNGEVNKSKLVYYRLEEATQKVVIIKGDDHYSRQTEEKKAEKPPDEIQITYVNGIVKLSDEYDKQFIKYMKTNNSCKVIDLDKN